MERADVLVLSRRRIYIHILSPHMLNGFIPNRACLAFFSQICIENNEAECLFVLHVRRSDLYSSRRGQHIYIVLGNFTCALSHQTEKEDSCTGEWHVQSDHKILFTLINPVWPYYSPRALSPPSRPFSCLRRLCANALAALPEKIACARGEKKRPHVIQNHVQLWGLCDNCHSPKLYGVCALGYLMARRIMKKSWVYGWWKH